MARSSERLRTVDVIRPFVEAAEEVAPIQIFGGVLTDALIDERTVILPDERRVIAPFDLESYTVRSDGTKRDIDVLVPTTDRTIVREVKDLADTEIGKRLKRSVFGLRPAAVLERQIRSPKGLSANKTVLADRYVTTREDGQIIEAKKALIPFAAKMNLETLEPWRLALGYDDDNSLPITGPYANVLNYMTRSISGLRPKDDEKIHKMVELMARNHPEGIDWINDGPGSSQVEFARVLQKLNGLGTVTLGGAIEVTPCEEDLLAHPMFLLKRHDASVQQDVLDFTRKKAAAMRRAESMEWLVTYWQKLSLESVFKGIVHNK